MLLMHNYKGGGFVVKIGLISVLPTYLFSNRNLSTHNIQINTASNSTKKHSTQTSKQEEELCFCVSACGCARETYRIFLLLLLTALVTLPLLLSLGTFLRVNVLHPHERGGRVGGDGGDGEGGVGRMFLTN